MKEKGMYKIFNFNQAVLVDFKLDLNDTLIINYIANFIESGKMVTENVNGEKFYWVDYKSLLKNLPILWLKKDALYKRLKVLVNKKILKHYTKKREGTYSFYALGEKYEDLLYKNTKTCGKIYSQDEDENPYQSEGKLEAKDIIIKDYNNIESKKINTNCDSQFNMKLVEDIIGHLNYISGKNFSYDNKTYILLIKKWVLEGYTIDDFKRVIEVKWSQWKNTNIYNYFRPETLFGDRFPSYSEEKIKVSSFNNFEGRKYDYEKLERQLLGWDD